MAKAKCRPRLELHLEEIKPAFRSDRVITGWALLDWQNQRWPEQLSKFYVECIGYWEAVELSSTGSPRRHRRENFSLRRDLLPANRVLESGRYELQIRLGANLPHSIECDDVGFVRYYCRVVLEDSASLCTAESIKYFTLIEEVDLNSAAVREVCRPNDRVSATTCKRLTGIPSKSGDVKASIVLSKSAYVPGESVDCSITLTSSSVSILPVDIAVIRLVQMVVALGEDTRGFSGAHGASRISAIVENQIQSDEQYSQHCWMARCQVHIPGTVPTTLLHERSTHHPLAVSYELEVEVCIGSTGKEDIKVRCPVLIGTTPLVEPGGLSPRQSATSMQWAVVEISRFDIPEGDHLHRETRPHHHSSHYWRSSSLVSQLSPAFAPGQRIRQKSSSHSSSPTPYSLYCIYYPMLSLVRKPKTSLKSILKRHSTDDSIDSSLCQEDRQATVKDEDQLDARVRTSSSWYETPL